MNELALFAGGGGGILGTKLLGWKTVCAVEWDPYCQAVLLARQADGLLERFPIWDDVKTFQGTPWRGKVDVITAGFPCQPFSSAGKRKGESDERNGWPDTIRIIRDVAPRFALLENVPGLLNWDGGRYFGEILGQLSESGFDARWKVISAGEIGAPHKRDRLWIMAYSKSERSVRRPEEIQRKDGRQITKQGGKFIGASEKLAYPTGTRRATRASKGQSGGCGEVDNAEGQSEGRLSIEEKAKYAISGISSEFCNLASQGLSDGRDAQMGESGQKQESKRSDWWSVEPPLGRVAHGVAHRVDRLKALGNGQVPAVAARAFLELSRRFYA